MNLQQDLHDMSNQMTSFFKPSDMTFHPLWNNGIVHAITI